jgi:hypothetical protein
MRFETSSINPLETLLSTIPKEGIVLNRDSLTNLGNIFKTGGIVAENYQEVFGLLLRLEEYYKLVVIEFDNNKTYTLKVNNGN